MQRVLATVLVLLSAPAAAQSVSWELEDESVVRFICAGPQITNPARGRFGAVSGRVTMDPNNLSTTRGAIEVLLASITTELGGWDAMFRAAPFLGVDEYPRAKFELLEVRGPQRLRESVWVHVRLSGRFTLKGTAHDMVIPARVRWLPAEGDTPERVEILATFLIRWPDFDISVPTGWTRNFAGDRARVRMRLLFRRNP